MEHPQGLWIFVPRAQVLSKTAEKSGLRFPSCVRLPLALEVLVVTLYGGKRKKGFPPLLHLYKSTYNKYILSPNLSTRYADTFVYACTHKYTYNISYHLISQ